MTTEELYTQALAELVIKDKRIELLEKELKVLNRAYEELYAERYGTKPTTVYGHV